MIGIKYVGKKPHYADRLYGTRLEWQPGQIHNVEDGIAEKMLVHTDIYAQAKPIAKEKPATALPEEDDGKDEDLRNAPPLVDLNALDKVGLQDYAFRYLGEKLAPQMKEENMRTRIAALANGRFS